MTHPAGAYTAVIMSQLFAHQSFPTLTRRDRATVSLRVECRFVRDGRPDVFRSQRLTDISPATLAEGMVTFINNFWPPDSGSGTTRLAVQMTRADAWGRIAYNAVRMRVGAVNYLNSKPLVDGLQQLAPEVRLLFDLPSRLADS
jgi:hypothetical protein